MLKTTLVIISLSAFSLSIHGATTSNELCRNYKEKGYFQKLISNNENRLIFTNRGGLLNGGVCWWHSRFTRNATYLATFNPNSPKPSKEQAIALIKKIKKGNRMAHIPGYKNLADFSSDYKALIQKELERWQLTDGVIRQQWITGLWGTTTKAAKTLRRWMDKLYQHVTVDDNIAYQKIQLKGIDAHAWLVYSMTKRVDGYDFKIIDSNSYYSSSVSYTFGDSTIHTMYGNTIPYLGQKREMRKLKKVVKRFCK